MLLFELSVRYRERDPFGCETHGVRCPGCSPTRWQSSIAHRQEAACKAAETVLGGFGTGGREEKTKTPRFFFVCAEVSKKVLLGKN